MKRFLFFLFLMGLVKKNGPHVKLLVDQRTCTSCQQMVIRAVILAQAMVSKIENHLHGLQKGVSLFPTPHPVEPMTG